MRSRPPAPRRLPLPAKGVVRDSLTQGFANYASAALVFARALALAAILTPLEFGAIALVSLLTTAAQLTDLGATAAMEQRLAEVRGGPETAVMDLNRAGFTAKIVSTIVASLSLFAYLAIFGVQGSALWMALVAAAVLFPLQGILFAQQSVLRALRNFDAVAKSVVFYASTNLVVGVLAASLIGFEAVLVSQVVVTAAAVAVTKGAGAPVVFALRPEGLGTLLRLGLPLAALLAAQMLLLNLGQIVAGASFGTETLGTFALVAAFGSGIYFAPLAIAAVMAPRTLGNFAASGDLMRLRQDCWRPTSALRSGMLLLIGITWAVVWTIFETLLVEHRQAGLTASLYYLAAMYFLGVNLGPNATLFAIRRHGRNILLLMCGLSVYAFSAWGGVRITGSLDAISLAACLGFACYLALHFYYVARVTGSSSWASLRLVVHYGWPGVALVIVMLATIHFAGTSGPLLIIVPTLTAIVLAILIFMSDRQFNDAQEIAA